MTNNQFKKEDFSARGEEESGLDTLSESHEKLKKGNKIFVDGKHLTFDQDHITGRQVLQKANKVPGECYTLYMKLKGCDFEKIDLDEIVDISNPGIEHFIVKPPEVFYYTVDAEPETTDQKELTPNQILELAGIIPVNDYYLVQINHDGNQTSYMDIPTIPIVMRCPAMKFVSVFRGETPVS